MSTNNKIADTYIHFLNTINPFWEEMPFDFAGLSHSFLFRCLMFQLFWVSRSWGCKVLECYGVRILGSLGGFWALGFWGFRDLGF